MFKQGQGIFLYPGARAEAAPDGIYASCDYSLDRLGHLPRSARNHPLKVGRVTVKPSPLCPDNLAARVDGTQNGLAEETLFLDVPAAEDVICKIRCYRADAVGTLRLVIDGQRVQAIDGCGELVIEAVIRFAARRADILVNGAPAAQDLPVLLKEDGLEQFGVAMDGGSCFVCNLLCCRTKALASQWYGVLGRYHAEPPMDAAGIVSDIRRRVSAGSHPRLYLTDERRQRILARLHSSDPATTAFLGQLQSDVEQWIADPPPAYCIADGIRLLPVSRLIKRRCLQLSVLFRLTGDMRYAQSCWNYLEQAARYPDWNETHFLDVAELCCGFAIAYDAIYDALDAEQRRICEEAILQKALYPALYEYRYGCCATGNRWSTSGGNWNPVCNAGILIGAIAIMERDAALAEEIIGASLAGIMHCLDGFAPDGAWPEGVGYWHYTVEFICYYFDALYTTAGSVYGYLDRPGVRETVRYYLAMLGPGGTFNYGDMEPQTVQTPELFWYAEVLHQPELAALYDGIMREYGFAETICSALHRPAQIQPAASLPLDMVFGKWWVGSLRTSWSRQSAVYIAFQGGRPDIGHSQMSIGNFVLDAKGERWLLDLGYDDYNLNYLDCSADADAWWMYRKSAEGHNCLILSPDDRHFQKIDSNSAICAFTTGADSASATLDLSPAYVRQATEVKRQFTLDKRNGEVTITDRFCLRAQDTECYWFAHTAADITIDKNRAVLRQNGKELVMYITAPETAVFTVMEPRPLPTTPHIAVREKEAKNEGVRKLAIHLEHLGGQQEIKVMIQGGNG